MIAEPAEITQVEMRCPITMMGLEQQSDIAALLGTAQECLSPLFLDFKIAVYAPPAPVNRKMRRMLRGFFGQRRSLPIKTLRFAEAAPFSAIVAGPSSV